MKILYYIFFNPLKPVSFIYRRMRMRMKPFLCILLPNHVFQQALFFLWNQKCSLVSLDLWTIFDARRVLQSHSLRVLTFNLCVCPKTLNLLFCGTISSGTISGTTISGLTLNLCICPKKLNLLSGGTICGTTICGTTISGGTKNFESIF